MDSNNLRQRYFTGRVYVALSPLILLTALVWFTPDWLAIQLGYVFQIYLTLLLTFSSSYLLTQSRILNPLLAKRFSLTLALKLLVLAFGGGSLTYYFNSVYGLSFLLAGLLVLFLFKLSKDSEVQIPSWFKELVRKGNIMICICLIVMIGYWLNPYSDPLSYLIK